MTTWATPHSSRSNRARCSKKGLVLALPLEMMPTVAPARDAGRAGSANGAASSSKLGSSTVTIGRSFPSLISTVEADADADGHRRRLRAQPGWDDGREPARLAAGRDHEQVVGRREGPVLEVAVLVRHHRPLADVLPVGPPDDGVVVD